MPCMIRPRFSLGFEEEVKHFLNGIKRAWGIALIGAIGPFVTGYGLTLWFFGEQKIALMSGLTMTATAVSLTMVSLKNCGLGSSKAAMGIMTSAVLDDIGSLALVAIMVPLVASDEGVSASAVGEIIGKAVAFFAIVGLTNKFVFPERIRLNWCGMDDTYLNKYGLRHLVRIDKEQTTLIVLLIGLLFGLLAHVLGFHPGIGAYMGALVLKRSFFADDSPYHDVNKHKHHHLSLTNTEGSVDESDGHYIPKKQRKQRKARTHQIEPAHNEDMDDFEHSMHVIDNIAMSWLGPVFFVLLGGKLVIDPEKLKGAIGQIFALYACMVVAQFFTASIAARYVPGGFNFVESVMIGFGMLGRAELAFVVLNIAYVDNKILTEESFYVLLITCFLLNITAPILITFWKPYYEGKKAFPYFQKEPQKGGMGGGRTASGHIVLSKEMFDEMLAANKRDDLLHPEMHPSLHPDHPEYAQNLLIASQLLHDEDATGEGRDLDEMLGVERNEQGKILLTQDKYDEMAAATSRDDLIHPEMHPALHPDHPEYASNLLAVSKLMHHHHGDATHRHERVAASKVTPISDLEKTLDKVTS